MTAFCRDQCRLHASRTGTNDKYMLLIPGRRQRPFMFETDIGIHGAANRLAIARPQEATIKIADTGTDLAGLVVPAFVGPFGIGNYGTGGKQLGRAWCRESVGKYVSISVLAVLLKKKHKETKKTK